MWARDTRPHKSKQPFFLEQFLFINYQEKNELEYNNLLLKQVVLSKEFNISFLVSDELTAFELASVFKIREEMAEQEQEGLKKLKH